MKGKTISAKVISVTDDNRPIVLYKGKEYPISMGMSNTIDSRTLIGKTIMVLYMPLNEDILRFPIFQGVNEILSNKFDKWVDDRTKDLFQRDID